MAETAQIRAPSGLKQAGRRLWRDVTAEFDLQQEPHKRRLLEDACRVTDTIAELERAMADEPLSVRGSAGQMTIHPFISEARFQRALLAQLLARLNFEGPEEV